MPHLVYISMNNLDIKQIYIGSRFRAKNPKNETDLQSNYPDHLIFLMGL